MNIVTPFTLSCWLRYILFPLSEFIPWKYSQRRGNSSHNSTIMQSTPPYSAALYLHYLLWDSSGECSRPLPVSSNLWCSRCFTRVPHLRLCFLRSYLNTFMWETRRLRLNAVLNLCMRICFPKSNVLSVSLRYKQTSVFQCALGCVCLHVCFNAPHRLQADIFSILSKLIDFN